VEYVLGGCPLLPLLFHRASIAYRLRLLFLDRWNLWSRLTYYHTWQGPEEERMDGSNNLFPPLPYTEFRTITGRTLYRAAASRSVSRREILPLLSMGPPSCWENKDTRQATIQPDLPLADGSLILPSVT